ncbi:MAG TPA: cupredoxin family copper-binding protein [Acetobacteraceae bacterium]|nr:cupredoxin family copper-binding protein [Acetobacteraceae bacterium]
MAEIIDLAEHGRRVLLRRLAAGTASFALLPPALRAAEAPTVRIDNFTFTPTPLTVAKGTTVTWVNQDDIPHSIYCAALNLHSHPLDTGDSFAARFDKPGTFDYICAIHPHMHGQVVVTD